MATVERAQTAREGGRQSAGGLSHRQILTIFSGLMLAMALAAVDQTIVATALPTIVGDLGGLDHLTWVVTAYVLTSTVSTPLYGKLGDQFGRKRLLQTAVVLFVAGSALCGLSQSMLELILFRAVQGLGAGGLMVLSQAAIADVISPRERGRYMGYFGAVFGGTTIAGPLVGGFITDHLSWRWIFYVNLPLGAIALFVIGANLPARKPDASPQIDYLGATVLAGAVTSFVLMTTWGGHEYAWASAPIIGLLTVAAVLVVVFIGVERRAPEPLLPLDLFRDRTFKVCSSVGAVQGVAMMGTSAFIPLFLQVVVGVSATNSGLNMAPMMAGVISASLISGRLITRNGRYRWYPVVGTACGCGAMLLLASMGIDTSRWTVMGYMVVLGLGMGLIMQVATLATQNAVPPSRLGVATSSVQFFRSIGMLLGVATFGTIFNSRLAHELDRVFGSGGAGGGGGRSANSLTPAALRALPPDVRHRFREAFAAAIPDLFLYCAPLLALALVVSLFLPEIPLRQWVAGADPESDPETADIAVTLGH